MSIRSSFHSPLFPFRRLHGSDRASSSVFGPARRAGRGVSAGATAGGPVRGAAARRAARPRALPHCPRHPERQRRADRALGAGIAGPGRGRAAARHRAPLGGCAVGRSGQCPLYQHRRSQHLSDGTAGPDGHVPERTHLHPHPDAAARPAAPRGRRRRAGAVTVSARPQRRQHRSAARPVHPQRTGRGIHPRGDAPDPGIHRAGQQQGQRRP